MGYALIEGRPYATERGAHAHALQRGWTSASGGVLSVDATMRKLARTYRCAVLIRDDGSVVTFAYTGGKVRQRVAEAGSEEAHWLSQRLRDALKG